VRRWLGLEITAHLVLAFVLSRLDYCNALLAELPASTLAPLQWVMHTAARLKCGFSPSHNIQLIYANAILSCSDIGFVGEQKLKPLKIILLNSQ